MKSTLSLFFCLISLSLFGQTDEPGLLSGSVLDGQRKALEGASVVLEGMGGTYKTNALTDKNGFFEIQQVPFGYHRLRVSYVGMQTLTIDSIHFRAERYDFNLNDIILKATGTETLNEVVIYAEKPLIQSKDGNITFNAGESALSAGSSASELLTSVPLVTKDPDGKLMVRGKEPKILIDDKPVELNMQQLQDLLESLPGSSIEKIEVMTNPPPQYASEQGGVINIVTRKGRVGKGGRITVSGGTRGEGSVNGNFNYRKSGFAININAGAGMGLYQSQSYSSRQNLYSDSSNFFHTRSGSRNENLRPNLRVNVDYEINKRHSLNMVLAYSGSRTDNQSNTTFRNVNRFDQPFRLSERTINSDGETHSPNAGFTYTFRSRKAGEVFRVISSAQYSDNENMRNFYQQFQVPETGKPNGVDSSQWQRTNNRTKGYNLRLQYDLPLSNKKTFLSVGSYYNGSISRLHSDAEYKRRSDGKWLPLSALTNDFIFRQQVLNARASVKQVLATHFSVTAGLSAERTGFDFELQKQTAVSGNDYWSFLPFATLNRNWREKLNLTLSYRRTVHRPGVTQLNPTVDSADNYNIRSGNIDLKPSLAHTVDLVLGRIQKGFYANLGFGYNRIDDVFNQIRQRISDTVTLITWQNISGKSEYEVSTWSGYTIDKKTKVNLSASYTYNQYGKYDKEVRKFRDGGSFTSNLNSQYIFSDLYNVTGSFTFNRFANPQGTLRSSMSMNLGFQAKLLQKKLTATVNFIDPFRQQQYRNFTYGTNFILESGSETRSRNMRLTLSYNLTPTPKRKPAGQAILKT